MLKAVEEDQRKAAEIPKSTRW